MNKSAISWTTVTWNPVHGCSMVSEGCRNCYAATLSLRRGWTKKPWIHANSDDNVMLKPHKLKEPLKLKEPSRIFVNSMSDLFHENVPDDYIRQVFDIMEECPHHVFQVLTKRPERARSWGYKWGDNVWMGTSVEDNRVKHRIDSIRECGAKVKFISAEPLIAPLTGIDLTGIDWLIVGGESGKGYRKMPHSWARDIRDACLKYDTAFFFKQSSAFRTEMGTSLRHEDGTFYQWQQFPDDMSSPTEAEPHKYVYEGLDDKTAK